MCVRVCVCVCVCVFACARGHCSVRIRACKQDVGMTQIAVLREKTGMRRRVCRAERVSREQVRIMAAIDAALLNHDHSGPRTSLILACPSRERVTPYAGTVDHTPRLAYGLQGPRPAPPAGSRSLPLFLSLSLSLSLSLTHSLYRFISLYSPHPLYCSFSDPLSSEHTSPSLHFAPRPTCVNLQPTGSLSINPLVTRAFAYLGYTSITPRDYKSLGYTSIRTLTHR